MAKMKIEVDMTELDVATEKAMVLSEMLDKIEARIDLLPLAAKHQFLPAKAPQEKIG